MEWFLISIWWYIIVSLLGVLAFPIVQKIFKSYSLDYAYPFAKVISILLITYGIYLLSICRIVPFNQLTLIVGAISLYAFSYLYLRVSHLTKKQWIIILFEETLFFIAFIFWTIIRSQEPSIHSLEKFMDFGFINSILKTDFFPTKDIWYAGSSINYYYFGHITGAMLIKLTGTLPSIGYNLILSTIFGLGITQVFSITINLIHHYHEKITQSVIHPLKLIIYGILGTLIANLGGNLHTIYLFTKGYPNEEPVPFWTILSWFNPSKYWYPNATRFIPFTIHEFPSYSYVVADLHGHVFDIPFVLLTLALISTLFMYSQKQFSKIPYLFFSLFLGFMTAIHYMTNAFDGPIYLLLCLLVFLVLYKFSVKLFISISVLIIAFILFSFPFSYFFKPFVSGIGVNCSPSILSEIGKIGPFLFEKNNCQISPIWMLFVLWGYFWINLLLFSLVNIKDASENTNKKEIVLFVALLFLFGTFLILIPEFFYIKDIYPAHFRANTMFKLGYQAFIMMSIASIFVFFQIKTIHGIMSYFFRAIFIILTAGVLIYPFFSIPSYYGSIQKKIQLDGSSWLNESYPEDKEIIDYLNLYEHHQPTILEAQGDSYTDYERISSFTGLPTVAGWWVHEWLWRGSSTIVSDRIPDIETIYQSEDMKKTISLIRKYQIKYIVVSRLERQKYPLLKEEKINKIGKRIFQSSNGLGALYQVK